MKKYNINAVHSHNGSLIYASIIGRLAGINSLVHTDHGRYYPEKKRKILEDRIGGFFVKYYVCVSNQLKTYVINTVKINKKKLYVVLNGIKTDQFYKFNCYKREELRRKHNFKADDVVVGVVCRLVKPKNIVFLVEWFIKSGHGINNLKLVIAGDGEEKQNLLAISDSFRSRVVFTGYVSEVQNFYNTIDIFVLPSKTEGTSLTLLEAMSCELPVLASDVGGNKKIVADGHNGFIFELNNMNDFDIKIRELIKNASMRNFFGKNGREIVKSAFSFNEMAEKYYAFYQNKSLP